MSTENRDFLQKADLQLSELTSGGGLLKPAQAKKFMRLLIEEPTILKEVTVKPMTAPSELIEKTGFLTRMLRAATEGEALNVGDRSKPYLGKVQLDAKEVIGEVRLGYSAVEDNIEQETWIATVQEMISERFATDLEDLAVNGDTASSTPFLALHNGMLKAATSYVVDAGVIPISRTNHLKAAIKLMPNAFRRNKKRMRFYTSLDAEADYRDSLADRGTNLGDRVNQEDVPVAYNGVPIVGCALFPDTLNAGGGSNETNIIFTDPENFHIGLWREIRMEWDKDITARQYRIVVTARVAQAYAHEPAVVKVIKVRAN